MADSTRIRLPDRRERLYDELQDATGENSTSRALDEASETYLQLVGRNHVETGDGALGALLSAADERGGLRAEEIAEILSDHDLPVEFQPAEWSVGE